MPDFDVTIAPGHTYTVTAPDEKTAWKWARATYIKEVGIQEPTAQPTQQPGLLDQPLPQLDKSTQELLTLVNPGLGFALGGEQPSTLAGLGGAVARGNPLTAAAGLSRDVHNILAQYLGGKHMEDIQDTLTSWGVPEAKSNAEKLVQLISGFIPIGPGATKDPAGVEAGAQIVKDAKGARVMTSDVFPPKGPVGQFMQTLSERNPFLGTGSLRVAQQGDRIQAIRDLAKQYGATDLADSTDSVMTDLLQKRGADLARLTQQKNEVIDRLSEPARAMTDAQGVPVESAPAAPIPVPVTNTVNAIDGQIAKLKSLKTKEVDPVIAKLEDWKSAVQDQTLSNVELLRKQFGNSFNDPGLAGVKDTAQKSLNAIYPAVNEDMGAFIKANGKPEDYAQWQSANADLANSVGELENTALRTALDRGDQTPELVQRLLFSGKRSDNQTLFRNLTEDGRQRARAAILAKAIDNSMTSGTEMISPEKFLTQVQKLGGPVGVFFAGEDKAAVEGVLRYLNATRQASKFTANPQTGIQNFVPLIGISSAGGLSGLMGGGAVGAGAGLAGTIVGGTTVGLLTRAYESPAVRDALIALARAKNPENIAQLRRVTATLAAIQNTKDAVKQPAPPQMSATALEQKYQGAP